MEPLTRMWMKFWNHWRQFGLKCGTIDANLDQILEQLTPFGSQLTPFGSNVEPLTPSRFCLAWKLKLGGLFRGIKKTLIYVLMVLQYLGGKKLHILLFLWSDRVPLSHRTKEAPPHSWHPWYLQDVSQKWSTIVIDNISIFLGPRIKSCFGFLKEEERKGSGKSNNFWRDGHTKSNFSS